MDCSHQKISNSFKTETWVLNIALKGFTSSDKNVLFDEVTNQMIDKLDKSIHSDNVQEITKYFSKTKSVFKEYRW